jgi:ABC-type glycerol-3-phosphate transport system substrate-binding protein
MNKRSIMLLTMAAAMFVMMAGLMLSIDTVPTMAQDAEPTPIVAEAGEGDIQLRYWNGLTGSDGVTMVEMVQQFTDANEDVAVRVEMMQWDTYFDKLVTSLVAGDPPDLFLLHHQELPQFARLGVLMPTDDMFDYAGGPLPADDFAEPIFSATLYEGVRYGVVIDNHGFNMWVNNDLLEAAGIDPTARPENAEQFLEYAIKLTLDANGLHPDEDGFDAENIVQYGTHVSWMKPTYLSTLWQFGGDIVSEDGTTATINSEAGIAALQYWYDLIYVYHVAPVPAGFDTWQTFAAGGLAMVPEGSWFRNFLVLDNPEVNWTVWGMPQWGDVQEATWESSHVVYFPASLSGEKLEAARELVVYLSEQGMYWALSGQIPARVSQQEALDPETFPSNIVFGQAFQDFGVPEMPSIYSIELVDAFQFEIDAALNDLKSVEDALNDANDAIQSVLDRSR